MLPGLHAGQEILYDPHAYYQRLPQLGEIVVCRHPLKPTLMMVKRIQNYTKQGKFFLMGDNAQHSTDSRLFGPVPLELIQGKVTCLF